MKFDFFATKASSIFLKFQQFKKNCENTQDQLQQNLQHLEETLSAEINWN